MSETSTGYQPHRPSRGYLIGYGVKILKRAWGRVDIQHLDGSVVSIHERRLPAYLEELRSQRQAPPPETSAPIEQARPRAEERHKTWRSRMVTEAS